MNIVWIILLIIVIFWVLFSYLFSGYSAIEERHQENNIVKGDQAGRDINK